MKLSIRERYGLQALAILAAERPGRKLRAQEIAERESIPRKFLEQVLLSLKKAGLVESARGRDGGYVLRSRPEEVTLRQILEAFKGPGALLACLRPDAEGPCQECHSLESCWLRPALREVNAQLSGVLDQVTLADLAGVYQATHRNANQAYMFYI